MIQYRQTLVRLRAGDTDREIARSKLMGRDKVARLRSLALAQGWLDAPIGEENDRAPVLGLLGFLVQLVDGVPDRVVETSAGLLFRLH